MPYKRSFRKFRRNRRTRPGRKSWSSYIPRVSTVKSLWRGFKYIKGLVNAEMYHYDYTQTGVGLNATPGVYHCSAVAIGDGESDRTGNSVLAKAVNIRGKITLAAGGNNTVVRLVVVQDNQQVGGSYPGWTDVFQGAYPYSHLNKLTVGRFRILYTRTFSMVPTAESSVYPISINVPLQHHIRYNNTTGGSVQKGGIYFMCVSDQSSGNPVMDFESRFNYHDN